MGRKARRKKVKDENREDWRRKKGTGPEKKGGRLRAVSGAFVEVGKEKKSPDSEEIRGEEDPCTSLDAQ